MKKSLSTVTTPLLLRLLITSDWKRTLCKF